jgi:hypothetical protein
VSKPKDLFSWLVPHEKLNTNLLKIMPHPTGKDFHGPTRIALQESFDKLPKPDGNFIKDFQSAGFDGRVWELYLNEMFRCVGLKVEQPFDRPDFMLSNGKDEVWVEAVTANSSQVFAAEIIQSDDLWRDQDEVAIKLGGPLTDKLKKKYWELPHVVGKPLVLAIADFHDSSPGFRNSSHALERYAYGIHARLLSSMGEEVSYVQQVLQEHVGRKTIPSGFFSLEGVENVSALLFSNAGTVAKFSRMGFVKNPVPGMILTRMGIEYDEDPTAIMPRAFACFVEDDSEGWNDEAVVLHNPYAKHPLPKDFFGTTAQNIYEDGNIRFFVCGPFTYASVTQKYLCAPEMVPIQREARVRAMEAWLEKMNDLRPGMEARVVEAHRKKKPI